MDIAFDERGLVPCIVQDWRTGEVLTLAYMNAEALKRTRETGEIHFFSRSRRQLWHKGETSGNTQAVKAIRYDCDADALLALVEPTGPACHTGELHAFNVTGKVGPNGAVTVTVSRGNQSASGSGQLSATDGGGHWASASGECSGTWTAERRS